MKLRITQLRRIIQEEVDHVTNCQTCIEQCKKDTACGKEDSLFTDCSPCVVQCEEEFQMSCADQATLDKLNRPTLSREEHEEFLKGFTKPAPLAR